MNPVQHAVEKRGFTLIELSIVLVIIGLLAGGVMVGRDLVKASEIRGQVAQIDKYNSAVNAFYSKYGGIPGDLNANLAAKFGFVARAGILCRGDGDGILEGYFYSAGQAAGQCYVWNQAGENLLFWVDLSTAGFMDGTFTAATDAQPPALSATSSPGFSAYMPKAKLGNGNYIYVYSNAWQGNVVGGLNYYGIAAPVALDGTGSFTGQPGMSVLQAYGIDKKMDDGLPTSGSVIATYLNGSGNSAGYAPSALTDSTTTCYNTTNYAYSLGTSAVGGTNINCALSFQMITPE